MAKANSTPHILDNPKLVQFRKMLADAGFATRPLWCGKTELTVRTDDLALIQVMNGPDDTTPAVRTFIVKDYGEGEGYGIFFESPSNSFDDDMKAIIGK